MRAMNAIGGSSNVAAPASSNNAASTSAPEQVEGTSVLPPPDFTAGDPVATLAGLFVKSSAQKRKGDSLTADLEEKAEDAADARRIEALKNKAEANLQAGIISGLASIAEGAGSIAAGCTGLNGPDNQATKGEMQGYDGAGKSGAGGLKIVEAALKYAADMYDVAANKAESESKQHRRAAEALRKESDAALQHEGKVTQLLQDIKQAQQACEHAALLKM